MRAVAIRVTGLMNVSLVRLATQKILKAIVGTHYCLAVGNDEGLELDETDEDEELGESNEE